MVENYLYHDHHQLRYYLTKKKCKIFLGNQIFNFKENSFTLSDKFNSCRCNRWWLSTFDRPDWWPGKELEFPAPGFDVTELVVEVVGNVRSATLLFLLVDGNGW